MHRSKILCFNLKITYFFFQCLSNSLLGNQIVECKEYVGIGNEDAFSATLAEFYWDGELKALLPAELL